MFSSSLALTPGFLFFRKGRQELCCEVFIRREQRQKVQMQRTKKQRQLELGHFSNQFFLCFLTGTQMPTRQWIPQYIHILQIVCFVSAMKEQTHVRYQGSLVNSVSYMLLQAEHDTASSNFIWNRQSRVFILLTGYMTKQETSKKKRQNRKLIRYLNQNSEG